VLLQQNKRPFSLLHEKGLIPSRIGMSYERHKKQLEPSSEAHATDLKLAGFLTLVPRTDTPSQIRSSLQNFICLRLHIQWLSVSGLPITVTGSSRILTWFPVHLHYESAMLTRSSLHLQGYHQLGFVINIIVILLYHYSV